MAACKPVSVPDFPPDPRLFSRLLELNQSARLAVCVFMSELVNGARIAALIDQIARERKRCPNCEGKTFYRHGFASGLQRYRCRSSGVTFCPDAAHVRRAALAIPACKHPLNSGFIALPRLLRPDARSPPWAGFNSIYCDARITCFRRSLTCDAMLQNRADQGRTMQCWLAQVRLPGLRCT